MATPFRRSPFSSFLAAGLAAGLLVAGATHEAHARVHSLTGNVRYMIGGVPIPVTQQPIPNDRILAIAGAIVHQTTGPDPKVLRIPPSQLANGLPNFPTPNVNAPIFLNNSAIFQVRTQLPIQFPVASATFSVGGRTGNAIVRICAGQGVGGSGNPNCPGPLSGPLGTANPGRLVYTATGNQFGGPAQGAVQGSLEIAVAAGGVPPGPVTALFYFATPPSLVPQGAPFGFFASSVNAVPSPDGEGRFTATAGGALTGVIASNLGAGLANSNTSYGGPWTTGRLTVEQPGALGSPETFVLSGSDGRVSGVGPISLVSGSISQRLVSGPNANRGWLNLVVGTPTVAAPALSRGGLAAAAALMLLGGTFLLRRRR